MRKMQNPALELQGQAGRERSQEKGRRGPKEARSTAESPAQVVQASDPRLPALQGGLKPYHQTRWTCFGHGFFDVMLPQKPPENYVARCPDCGRPAERREGYECTGYTAGALPRMTKPRLDETPEIEISLFDKAKVVKNRRGFYNRHKGNWQDKRR